MIEDEAVPGQILLSRDRSKSVSKKAAGKTCLHKYLRKKCCVLDSIHHRGWHAVAFIVHIAGCFSHAYFMVQIRNQTVRKQSTFTQGVRFMGSLVQSDGEALLLTVEASELFGKVSVSEHNGISKIYISARGL